MHGILSRVTYLALQDSLRQAPRRPGQASCSKPWNISSTASIAARTAWPCLALGWDCPLFYRKMQLFLRQGIKDGEFPFLMYKKETNPCPFTNIAVMNASTNLKRCFAFRKPIPCQPARNATAPKHARNFRQWQASVPGIQAPADTQAGVAARAADLAERANPSGGRAPLSKTFKKWSKK